MKGIKHDDGKLRWSLIPWDALEEVVRVLEHGARKYGAHNWRLVAPERYREALLRHVAAWAQGGVIDRDSGLPHLAHVAANAFFLLARREDGRDASELAASRALVDAVLEEQRNASSDRVVHLAATAMEVRGG